MSAIYTAFICTNSAAFVPTIYCTILSAIKYTKCSANSKSNFVAVLPAIFATNKYPIHATNFGSK